MSGKKKKRDIVKKDKFNKYYEGDCCEKIDRNKLNESLRKFKIYSLEFNKILKQSKNIGDNDADMDNLKNGVINLINDVNLIRMSQFFIYMNFKKLRGKTVRKYGSKKIRQGRTFKV